MNYDREETFITIFAIGLFCIIIAGLLNIASDRDNDLLEYKAVVAKSVIKR